MSYRFILVVIFSFSLFGEEHPIQFEGTLEGWSSKRLELISFFLPKEKINGENTDLIAVDLRDAELSFFETFSRRFPCASAIYMRTSFAPQIKVRFREVKKWMEKGGFRLLSHWYRRGGEGEAIFVRQSYFYNEAVGEFLEKEREEQFQIYYEPYFHFSYFLEEETTDSIKNILKQGLPYEGHIGTIIDHLTQKGSLAIDVGAHIGVHTLTMSRKVGPEGVVFSFEPNQKSYGELLQNLLLNRCNNVIPICKALGAESKQSLLGKHKIEEEPLGKEGEWVETIPLDSLDLKNVSLIKMDIENYEYQALLGARETILKNRPILIFECWIGKEYEKSPPEIRANFDRVIALLESYGYEIYVIFSNDFIAFPIEKENSYKANFKRLDLDHFDLGL